MFGLGSPSPSEREARLKEALLSTLQRIGATLTGAPRRRLTDLVDKLETGKIPRGLTRELDGILGTNRVDTAERSWGRTLQGLGRAMAAVALLDPSMERAIERFRDHLPERATEPEATRVARDAERLIEETRPFRERAERTRLETARRLAELSGSLSQAQARTSTVDGHALGMADLLANDPSATGALFDQLEAHLNGVRAQTRELEAELVAATAQAEALAALARSQDSELGQLRQELAQDPLTQALTRGAWDDALPAAVADAERADKPLSVLIVDIDHFKSINDRFGHPAGDAALIAVSRALRGAVRAEDCVARIGGEEFAVLLPRADAAAAERIAEDLRAAVEALRFVHDGERIPVTTSVGGTTWRRGQGPDDLYRIADAALYDAKRSGRNRCVHRADLQTASNR